MTTTDLGDVMLFDQGLALGDTVEVRWTNSGYSYRGAGTVAKLNEKSVRVALSSEVQGYPAGREILVPRCTFDSILRWSWRNGVFPTES